jgi:hypothetical protein
MKFKKYLKRFQPPLNLHGMNKELQNPLWKNQPHVALLTTGQCNVLLLDNDEPKIYTEVIMGPNSEKWLRAMKSEIESMHGNQV